MLSTTLMNQLCACSFHNSCSFYCMLLPQLLILSQLLLLPQLLLLLKLLFLQQLLPQLLLPSFEIRDKLVGSEINKLLHSYSSKTRPRQSSANMLHVRCLRYLMTSSSIMTTPSSIMTTPSSILLPPSVRPDPASPLEEASLKVSLQPFRLNIDQDTLFFIIDFANTLMLADPVPQVGGWRVQEKSAARTGRGQVLLGDAGADHPHPFLGSFWNCPLHPCQPEIMIISPRPSR